MPDQTINIALPHIAIRNTAITELYRRPATRGPTFRLPHRDRQIHGTKLLSQLNHLREETETIGRERAAFALSIEGGIYIEFESEPDFELKLDSLENARAGIELVSVRTVDNKICAVCFVPEGKIAHFMKLIESYLESDTDRGKPRNQSLVESVSDIRRAMLDALWTDDNSELPGDDDVVWWEVWLRSGNDREAFSGFFREHATRIGLTINGNEIQFPDRTVVLARGTKTQMSRSVNLLNSIAELRKAKETANFFAKLPPPEQHTWVNEAVERIEWPALGCPSICILDTGVNNGHPLLQAALDQSDMHSCNPAWNVADHGGHGTEMAGLALHGDLTDLLVSHSPITLTHRLESVKILPPRGQNPPELYGAITMEAVARVEIARPERQRTICMAVATKDFRDQGRPSSWSASLDKLASGADDDNRRLIVVSAGNTDPNFRHLYPDSNNTDQIHDPGQSWNVLTIGAYTEKTYIEPTEYPGWIPIAPYGDLSPCSCTSRIWQRSWPIKPDIVLEGGNMAINPDTGGADYADDMGLLTTNWQFTSRSLVVTGDTSAATALAARMSAKILAEYPDYWPETIRGLLVHSAEWTEAMRERFQPLQRRSEKETLLRNCGFGVPNLGKAMWSARNTLTLVAEDSLQPFDRFDNQYRTRDLNLHHLPWPTEALEDLGETPVEMRITLSYFIEPNPARRGWTRKHRYMSHGLRFEVKTPTETLNQFRQRINEIARTEDLGISRSRSDASKWFLGPDLRSLGSIHSDIWKGTAAELAQRGLMAVYPVIGWWRERHQLGRWGKRARYSLIVSIKTPRIDADVYTPVSNLVRPMVEVRV